MPLKLQSVWSDLGQLTKISSVLVYPKLYVLHYVKHRTCVCGSGDQRTGNNINVNVWSRRGITLERQQILLQVLVAVGELLLLETTFQFWFLLLSVAYYLSPPLPQNIVAYRLPLVPGLITTLFFGGRGTSIFLVSRKLNINISFQNSK